jgi:hypothetical protein
MIKQNVIERTNPPTFLTLFKYINNVEININNYVQKLLREIHRPTNNKLNSLLRYDAAQDKRNLHIVSGSAFIPTYPHNISVEWSVVHPIS